MQRFKPAEADRSPMKVAIRSACSIAGSDSGGGAGIQADVKTFTALGVWGLTVVTAVTAQNLHEVRGAWMLPAEAIAAQLEAVSDGFTIGAFKTGMLSNSEIVRAVAGHLPDEVPLVIDPVMVSTSGHPLLEEEAVADLIELLIPRAAVVTPNIPEACVLSRMDAIRTVEEMQEAAERIRGLGPSAVVVKGGHLAEGPAVDVLVDGEGTVALSGTMYPYSVHGSGCCFSAALTGFLALGYPVREAFSLAKEFMDRAVRAAAGEGAFRIVNPGGLYQ